MSGFFLKPWPAWPRRGRSHGVWLHPGEHRSQVGPRKAEAKGLPTEGRFAEMFGTQSQWSQLMLTKMPGLYACVRSKCVKHVRIYGPDIWHQSLNLDKIRWDRTTYSCTHHMLYLESYTATAAHQSPPRRYDISLVTWPAVKVHLSFPRSHNNSQAHLIV